MEKIVEIVVQNGLGVASFVALLYFIFNYISKMNDMITQISNTLNSIKDSLITLSARIDDIEYKLKERND